jgi:hypothetical protein
MIEPTLSQELYYAAPLLPPAACMYLPPPPPCWPVVLCRIGYLEQEPRLDAGATVADNIAPAVQHIK